MGAEERIVDPKTGGEKGRKDERFDLVPFDALDELARVYGFGAGKYADWNWLRGYAWSLSLGALVRHVSLFAQGQDRDPETGRLHLAHAAWHCLTLITFYLRGLGTDDRKPAPQLVEDPDAPIPYEVTESEAAREYAPIVGEQVPSWIQEPAKSSPYRERKKPR